MRVTITDCVSLLSAVCWHNYSQYTSMYLQCCVVHRHLWINLMMTRVSTNQTRLLLTRANLGNIFSHLLWRLLSPPQEQLQGRSWYKGTLPFASSSSMSHTQCFTALPNDADNPPRRPVSFPSNCICCSSMLVTATTYVAIAAQAGQAW